MLLESISAVIHTVISIGRFIKNAREFYEDQKNNSLSTIISSCQDLKDLYSQYSSAKDVYISNKQDVVKIINQIEILNKDLEILKSPKTNPKGISDHLADHVQ